MNVHDNDNDLRPAIAESEEEYRARRFGRRAFFGGLAGGVGTLKLTLAAAIIAENGLFHSPTGRLFAILGLLTLLVVSMALIVAGAMEWIHRPVRARQRLESARNNEMRALVQQLNTDVHERFEATMGLLALPGVVNQMREDLNARLDAVEVIIEKVPAVSEAFLAGMQLRAKVDDETS